MTVSPEEPPIKNKGTLPQTEEVTWADVVAEAARTKFTPQAKAKGIDSVTADKKTSAKPRQDAPARAESDVWAKVKESAALAKAGQSAKVKARGVARTKAEQPAKIKEVAAPAKSGQSGKGRAEAVAKNDARAEVSQAARAKAEADENARAKAEREARARAEQEAPARAEEEARVKAEEEARAKAEQEARARAELEARARAEEEARVRAEEEARVRAEEARARAEEARARAEEEARARAEEEARTKIEEEILVGDEDRAASRPEFYAEPVGSGAMSANVLTAAFETIAAEAMDYSKKSIESGSAFFEQLLGARSFGCAIQIPSEYAKKSYEDLIVYLTKIREAYASLLKGLSGNVRAL